MTDTSRELVLERLLDAPVAKVWRCWTEAPLLKQWFCPKPWSVARAELDVRPGGQSRIVMLSPEGNEFPSQGLYLEVVPERKLVFTDAFTAAWEPSEKAFMVAEVRFSPEGDKTHYIATARHWSAADRATHEQMGFHSGWGAAADQLEALARSL